MDMIYFFIIVILLFISYQLVNIKKFFKKSLEVTENQDAAKINISREEILKHKFPNIFWDNPEKIAEWYDWHSLSDLDRRQKFFSIVGRLPDNDEEYEINIYWYILAEELEKRAEKDKKTLIIVEQLKELSQNFHKQALKISKLKNEEILFILHKMWDDLRIEHPDENKYIVSFCEKFLKNCLESYKK